MVGCMNLKKNTLHLLFRYVHFPDVTFAWFILLFILISFSEGFVDYVMNQMSEFSWIYTECWLSDVPSSSVLLEPPTMSNLLFTYYYSSLIFNTIKYDIYRILKIFFVKASASVKGQTAITPLLSLLKIISIILLPVTLFYTNLPVPSTVRIWGD